MPGHRTEPVPDIMNEAFAEGGLGVDEEPFPHVTAVRGSPLSGAGCLVVGLCPCRAGRPVVGAASSPIRVPSTEGRLRITDGLLPGPRFLNGLLCDGGRDRLGGGGAGQEGNPSSVGAGGNRSWRWAAPLPGVVPPRYRVVLLPAIESAVSALAWCGEWRRRSCLSADCR